MAIGLPTIEVKGILGNDLTSEELQITIDSGEVLLKSSVKTFQGIPLHQKMREIINAGGIEGILRDLGRERNEKSKNS